MSTLELKIYTTSDKENIDIHKLLIEIIAEHIYESVEFKELLKLNTNPLKKSKRPKR
mgnify:CR=1 FL=1